MPFVSTQGMELNGPGGTKIAIGPGEIVPDFASWGIHQRRAHLRLGYVAEVQRDPEPPIPKPVEPEIMRADEAPLECPHCPGKQFGNKRGLAIHIGQRHR